MITYGSKSKLLAKETLIQECPNCGTTHSIDMHVYQRYAHIFWIPFFPLGKAGVSRCKTCNQVLVPKDMPDTLVESYKNLKTSTTTPAWIFSGLALTAGLLVMGMLSGNKQDEKNAIMLANPGEGDFLEIKISNGQYTLYRINEVDGDSIHVQKSPYVSKRKRGLSDLKKRDFIDEDVVYSKKALKSMMASGELTNIHRA